MSNTESPPVLPNHPVTPGSGSTDRRSGGSSITFSNGSWNHGRFQTNSANDTTTTNNSFRPDRRSRGGSSFTFLYGSWNQDRYTNSTNDTTTTNHNSFRRDRRSAGSSFTFSNGLWDHGRFQTNSAIDSFFRSPTGDTTTNHNSFRSIGSFLKSPTTGEHEVENELRFRQRLLQRPHRQQQQQQQQHQENVSLVPGEKDVLCGRGGFTINHPGNKKYRAVIKTNKAVYNQCRLHAEKRDVSIAIVAAIREGGGRFLQPRKVEDTNQTAAGTITWCEIGDPKAVEKTLQALREKSSNTLRTRTTKYGETAVVDFGTDEEDTEEEDDMDVEDSDDDPLFYPTTTQQNPYYHHCGSGYGYYGGYGYAFGLPGYLPPTMKTTTNTNTSPPQRPKGKRSAYRYFSRHIRPTVKEENPEASQDEITRNIRGRWIALGVNDRKEWNNKAAEDNLRYQREMSEYDPEYDPENADDATTTNTTINHHLQEHMTYKRKGGKGVTKTFIPEIKLATTNDQGEIVAGDYFKINDVPLHKVKKRVDVYEFVLKQSPDQVDAVCGDSRMIGAWNNKINNTDDNSDGAVAADDNTDGDANADVEDADVDADVDVDDADVDADIDVEDADVDADVDVDAADGDTDDTMAFTEKLTKFKKSFAIIIYKSLIQAFGNKAILIKCRGCESFLPISRYCVNRVNVIGLHQYCRRCARIKARFHLYNFTWLFPACPVDSKGVDSTTTTTTTTTTAEEEKNGTGGAFESLVHRVCLTHPQIPGGTAQLRMWLERYRPQYRSLESSPHAQRLLLDTIVRHVVRHVEQLERRIDPHGHSFNPTTGAAASGPVDTTTTTGAASVACGALTSSTDGATSCGESTTTGAAASDPSGV